MSALEKLVSRSGTRSSCVRDNMLPVMDAATEFDADADADISDAPNVSSDCDVEAVVASSL